MEGEGNVIKNNAETKQFTVERCFKGREREILWVEI